MTVKRIIWISVPVVLLLALIPFAARVVGVAEFKQEDRPENLQALLEKIHHTVYVKKEAKSAMAMYNSLIPNEGRARKALKDDIPPEALQKILDMHKKHGAQLTEVEMNKLAKPEQTVVQVTAVKTEEFTTQATREVLRPGMTFYSISFLEPGKTAGMRYHLFYWDGNRWTMLGPIWRALS